ncbi:MAG TPA: DUF167 family protein [Methanothermobacter sp.]|nr:conserved hypothetical protein [Methanothermobacter sp. MT-2]HHW05035.1 YggU family protein [Methanothermobacter sp.]HOK72541.1 DUF167 family protein [Methanothermobacter sp.]HOL69396.1 DUF167 family protein [Methanothermobacter sp.]HPQ04028.1 DUF167 family protein [Methanothermobacter sp.]
MEGIREDGEDLLVDIEVSPGSLKFEIGGYNPWRRRLEVKLKSQPLKGKANNELIREFSNILSKDVEIIKGVKSRYKTIKIRGIKKSDFIKKTKIEKYLYNK